MQFPPFPVSVPEEAPPSSYSLPPPHPHNDTITSWFILTAYPLFLLVLAVIILHALWVWLMGRCCRRDDDDENREPDDETREPDVETGATDVADDEDIIMRRYRIERWKMKEITPTFVFDRSRSDRGGVEVAVKGDIDECVICLEDIKDGEIVRVLTVCGHLFHKTCIDLWLKKQFVCPICRVQLRLQLHPHLISS